MVMSVAREVSFKAEPKVPVYSATDLTKDGQVAQIALNDQLYTLRITRAGKLILTK